MDSLEERHERLGSTDPAERADCGEHDVALLVGKRAGDHLGGCRSADRRQRVDRRAPHPDVAVVERRAQERDVGALHCGALYLGREATTPRARAAQQAPDDCRGGVRGDRRGQRTRLGRMARREAAQGRARGGGDARVGAVA